MSLVSSAGVAPDVVNSETPGAVRATVSGKPPAAETVPLADVASTLVLGMLDFTAPVSWSTAARNIAPVGSFPIRAATVPGPRMFIAVVDRPLCPNALPTRLLAPEDNPAPRPLWIAAWPISPRPLPWSAAPAAPVAAPVMPLLMAASTVGMPVGVRPPLGNMSPMVEPAYDVAPLRRPAFAMSERFPPMP